MSEVSRRSAAYYWVMTLLCVGLCAVVTAQDPADPPDPLADGSLLSDGMVRGLIKRGAYDLSFRLELDESQRTRMTDAMLQRWVPFVQRHRRDMAPLLSRMLEAQMDPDLPSADEAQEWARKARDMHDLVIKELAISNEQVSRLLNPQQLEKFRKHTAQMDTGMRMFRVELDKMAEGHLDQTLWAMDRRNRQAARRQRMEERLAERQSLPEPETADMRVVSVDAWEHVVSQFIKKFRLDETQKQVAINILEDVRGRARAHIQSHRSDMDAMHRALKEAARHDRGKVLKEHAQVVGPLNDLFGELQTRLERIPTDFQRQQAEAQAELDARTGG